MKPHILQKAFKSTIPVLAGYIVLGAGFGMIMKANNIGAVWAVLMSVFIYAGSMQYAAVGLITSGASLLSAAVTTLMVNARHLFYGISMIDKYKDAGIRMPYLIFSLTDETYSIVCSSKEDTRFCFWVSLLNQIYWVCGTIMGSLAGTYMKINTTGIDFALTALFITVFTQQWLSEKNHFPAICGVAVSVLCLLIFGKDRFLIPSMVLITAAVLIRGYVCKEVNSIE